MNPTVPSNVEAIRADPRYQQLVRARRGLGVCLTLAMLVTYFGFVLVVAFFPGILAIKLGDGVMTLGIPTGIGVILVAFGLTGFYVWRANATFDRLAREIRRDPAGTRAPR
jgi:uncharacterized membrane protein (DUF485 family)